MGLVKVDVQRLPLKFFEKSGGNEMPENQHKRYRIDLRKEEAEYFERLAEEKDVPVSLILKMQLHEIARDRRVEIAPLDFLHP